MRITKPQPVKEILPVASSRNGCPGRPYRGKRMGIATANPGLACTPRKIRGGLIGAFQHASIQRFESRKEPCEQLKIRNCTRACQAGEHVIGAEEQALLVEVYDEGMQIVPSSLDFQVLTIIDVVNPDMHSSPAGHRDADLFAQEEIGMMAEGFGGVNRIVVGDGDQVHSTLFQDLINGFGIVVIFPADPVQYGDMTRPRLTRVDVQIALHA
jgi:hypothetical protein